MATNRGSFLARVHQSVEKMRHARPGRAAYRDGISAQIRIGDCGEHAVFLMSNMDELDFPVAPQRVYHRVERIADDAVATFDARRSPASPTSSPQLSAPWTLLLKKALLTLRDPLITIPASAVSIAPATIIEP
jgi:hypothetical protein